MTTDTEALGTATYSPEDNKIRFYPFARLSKEDYARARSEGFIWAPKQELFVAPMWTPERADLMLEWCQEIGDEDKSLCERAEERSERFEEYSDHRRQDAEAARAGVAAIADGIPLGQPILVGHHSEKRARKDAERIENGMRKAVKMWDCSQYWIDRARGAIRHAKYKERPDVRARRIKGIEADRRKQERFKASALRALKFWEGGFKLKHQKTGEVRPLEITEENRERICHFLGNDSDMGYLPVAKHPTLDQHWHAWDCLRPDDQRYKDCPALSVQEIQTIARRHYPELIARYDRWIAHYDNRLAYERAMLEAAGGTHADRLKPEKGGACKCWVRRGWCEIVKVNKVSVSVADNWGNGGPDFLRTVPFDKLSEVISREQWQTMKQPTEAQIEAQRIAKFDAAHMAQLDAMSYGRKFRELGSADRDIIRAALRVKLGETIPENTGTPIPDKPQPAPAPAPKPERNDFDAMRESLKAGVQVVSAPQLFPTPPDLARRVVELAEIDPGVTVLEPSAGTGNLVKAIREAVDTEVVGVEINRELCCKLRTRFESYELQVRCADFLTCNGDLGKFERIVMNPPFANGADIKHIQHALTFLRPGGRLVAICANGPRQQEALRPLASQWIELDNAFAEAGTNVRTAIAVFE